MNDKTPLAPAVFSHTEDFTRLGPNGKIMDFYTLTEAIPGHPVDSTVSARTLERKGYRVPPKPHKNMPIGEEVDITHLDSIRAKVPPMYKLSFLLYSGVKGTYRLTPSMPIQMFPAENGNAMHFKFWGFDNYDVHTAFPALKRIGDDERMMMLEIVSISYSITVLGREGGPSISANYQHKFKGDVGLTYQGIAGRKRIFQFYNALEHLPKLPNGWRYIQFIG